MDGGNAEAAIRSAVDSVVRRAEVSVDDPGWLGALTAALGARLSLVALFVSPRADFGSVMRDAAAAFPEALVIGCTTAGEIGGAGYIEGAVVAIGFDARHFAADHLLIEGLDAADRQTIISAMIRKRTRLAAEQPDFVHEFAFLMIDGLSLAEDRIAAACADALGPVPLFGGSAGDGTAFRQTAVAVGGTVRSDAAILTYLRSDCRSRVFTLDHLTPTEDRLVVTAADPKRRLVTEINAEPAAHEYARVLGKDPNQLDPFTFAAYPLAVRFGGRHHVRAIRQVTPDGALVFFSAIEEGVVLSLAEASDMDTHLDRELARLGETEEPQAILACDCILRRLEAEQRQMSRQMSHVLAAHKVTGFSTYGEQFGGIHVNQTMTGVAIYAPKRTP